MTWLVKVRRNGGGESVISRHAERSQADVAAAKINGDYQADNYYVEEYDAAKSEWPTATRSEAFLAKRAEMNRDDPHE